MGRRSDHSPDQIREMTISVAQALLEKEGPKAVTARAIAKAIGYTPGTLYNVFRDLDDIRLHVNARSLDLLRVNLHNTRIAAQQREGATVESVLLELAQAQLDFIREKPTLWQQLFRYSLPPGQPLPSWYQGRIADTMRELEYVLEAEFPDDPERLRHLTRTLWSSFFGLCEIASYSRLSAAMGDTVESMTRTLVGLFLTGAREARD